MLPPSAVCLKSSALSPDMKDGYMKEYDVAQDDKENDLIDRMESLIEICLYND